MGGVAFERMVACGHPVYKHHGLALFFFTLSLHPHLFPALVPSHIHNILLIFIFLPLVLISSSLFSFFLTQIPFFHIVFFPFLLFISPFEKLASFFTLIFVTLTLLFLLLKHFFKLLLLTALIVRNLILKSSGIKLTFRESS